MKAGAAKDIARALRRHIGAGYAPGAVGVVALGDKVITLAEGSLDVDGRRKAQADSLFRITSMTKPVTAAATLMLANDGAFRVSDPVGTFLPELARPRVLRTPFSALDDTVPAEREITIQDLLSSTFGHGILLDDHPTPYQRALGHLPGFGMPNPAADISPDAWMETVGKTPLLAQPGERWIYSAASCVLGVLVARASQRDLPTFLKERVFDPLGMQDTGFHAGPAAVTRLATAYVADSGKLVEFDPPAGIYSRPPRFPAGDSGLVSSAGDYLKFARFMTTGRAADGRALLPMHSLAAMRRNRLTSSQIRDAGIMLGGDRGWGYGFAVVLKNSRDGLRKGAYGWNGGFGTSWFNDPASGLTGILLTNRLFDSPQTPPMHQDFWRAAYASLADS